MHVPFHIPFDNQRHFRSILPPDFDQRRLFKGQYAEKVRRFFLEQFHCPEAVLTASCTHALELAAMLLGLGPEDEVIVPSYTYVSTAGAFDRQGARIVLCDCAPGSPDMCLNHLESLIRPATKAVVAVHYGGSCVDMRRLTALTRRHGLFLVEDAAHALGAHFDQTPLGAFGDLAAFSFHETKNVTCGQGGVLLINNPAFEARARTLRDCGTNRHLFECGQADAYTWVDTGSVFNLPELSCAYLMPQLEYLEPITHKRRQLWDRYYAGLRPLQERGLLQLPELHPSCVHNAHIFYILLPSQTARDALMRFLHEKEISARFHYTALHLSPYYQQKYGRPELPNAAHTAERLLRLPLYFDLDANAQDQILECLFRYFTPDHSPEKTYFDKPLTQSAPGS